MAVSELSAQADLILKKGEQIYTLSIFPNEPQYSVRARKQESQAYYSPELLSQYLINAPTYGQETISMICYLKSKKSKNRRDFMEYLIRTYWKKIIDSLINTIYRDFLSAQITEKVISARLQDILGFAISVSQCNDPQVKRLVDAVAVPTDCIFQLKIFDDEYFLVFGKLKAKNRNRCIWLTSDKRKCTLWDSYYLTKLALIERIRKEYQCYIRSIESTENDLVYLSILDDIARRYHVD